MQCGIYFPSFSYAATYFTSSYASEIIAKYEKGGKYLPILHEATCDNYFIVKWLLKSNIASVILYNACIELVWYNLILTNYKQTDAKLQ